MSDTKLDVRVFPLDEPKGSTKAFASVALDDLVAIRGIRVIKGEKGLFVSMPQSQNQNTNEFRDIAFPIGNDLRKEVFKAVKDEYERVNKLAPEERGYERPEAAEKVIDVDKIKLEIQIHPIKEQNGYLKAFANINIDDLAEIRGLRVVDSAKGLFVSMPQSKIERDGIPEYRDIAFPLNGDLRKEINRAVLEKFESRAKTNDKSLENGLKKGAERTAGQTAAPRESAAKSHAGALV